MAELASMSELRFLETRQRLKEQIRKEMRKENGNIVPVEPNKKGDNFHLSYGSFFGPSQPAIAPRLIQHSKNYSVEHQLSDIRKLTSARSSACSVPAKICSDNGKVVTTAEKSKIQILKESRDYSFLSSQDGSAADPIPERWTLSASATKPKSVSTESRKEQSDHKQVVRNKGFFPKTPVSSSDSFLNSKVKPFATKKDSEEPKRLKLKIKVKQPAVSANAKETVSRKSLSVQGSKKRPVREEYLDDVEDEKALRVIRRMFNTERFTGRDDSDTVMETNYQGMMKEERRSAKLGRKEDIEQLRLLEEEEKRERMRMSRVQKKPKLNH